jgi:hypothetical protein
MLDGGSPAVRDQQISKVFKRRSTALNVQKCILLVINYNIRLNIGHKSNEIHIFGNKQIQKIVIMYVCVFFFVFLFLEIQISKIIGYVLIKKYLPSPNFNGIDC